MTVQFPANPSVGYQFVATNGTQYTWDGTKWLSNKDLIGGGGGNSDLLWTKDQGTSELYPLTSGDSVSVRASDSTETINLSATDGKITGNIISFDRFPDLT